MYSIDSTLDMLNRARWHLDACRGNDPVPLSAVADILKTVSRQEGVPEALKSAAEKSNMLAHEMATRRLNGEASKALNRNIDAMIAALRRQYWEPADDVAG